VNVRPIKYAYFIREDDHDALSRVIQNACTQWGGIRSLLIPVRPDVSIDPLYERLLKLHEPDSFVSYIESFNTSGHKDHNALIRRLLELLPNRGINLQHGDYFDRHDDSIHPLGVLPDEEPHSRKLIEHICDGSLVDRNVPLALFGKIYPPQVASYTKIFELEQHSIGLPSDASEFSNGDSANVTDFWTEQLLNSPFDSIINLTSYGIVPYRAHSGFESPRFNVIVVSSLSSLCLYWNIRATRESTQFHTKLGRRTLLLPEALLQNPKVMESLIAFIRSSIRFPNFHTNLHIEFSLMDEGLIEELRTAISSFDRLEEATGNNFYEQFTFGGGDPNHLLEPEEVSLSYGIRLPSFAEKGFVGTYYEGVRPQVPLNTELTLGHNEVLYEPPQGFRNKFQQSAIIDLDCDVWSRYPSDQGIANSIRQSSWFNRYGLSFITVAPENPAHIGVYLPDEWETLETYFKPRGYNISLSPAGKYGNAIIELIGGFTNLSSLSSKIAYDLLSTLTFRSTKKIGQQLLKQIGMPQDLISKYEPDLEEKLQSIIEDLDISPELRRVTKTFLELSGNLKRPEREALLTLIDKLSSLGIMKRGFTLRCVNCGTPSWYPLEIIKESVKCLGCSYKYPLPVKKAEGQEIQWEYTLNTLVNRMMDQDALIHVLALHHLMKDKEACCAVPGLLLHQAEQKGGRHVTDFDVIFISGHEFFAGECKAGSELGEKDFETARLAAEIGIQHFYYCTAKTFSDDTQQKINDLKSEMEAKETPMSVDILMEDSLFD
jgi:hypothetical protein